MTRTRLALVPVGLLLCSLACLSFSRAEPDDPAAAQGNIQITLNKKFIHKHKNRATIDVEDFVIDKAHKHPNPQAKDGDMHVAGRSETIGLPIVAEIMNANDRDDAVKKVHDAEGTGNKVKVSGVWRLWCEHAGTTKQVQFKPLQPFTTTNPDHVFELHPLTAVDDLNLIDTFRPIVGFKTKDAHDAFLRYENSRCVIRPADETVTLQTHMAGFNYVEFILELNEKPVTLEGMPAGEFVAQCKVRDLEGELLVRNRRMVFAKGTPPAQKVAELDKGKRLHVLGIPRIDLALVEWRVTHPVFNGDETLKWNLPYEIVVVGVYPGGAGGDE